MTTFIPQCFIKNHQQAHLLFRTAGWISSKINIYYIYLHPGNYLTTTLKSHTCWSTNTAPYDKPDHSLLYLSMKRIQVEISFCLLQIVKVLFDFTEVNLILTSWACSSLLIHRSSNSALLFFFFPVSMFQTRVCSCFHSVNSVINSASWNKPPERH